MLMSPANFMSVNHLWLQKTTKLQPVSRPAHTIAYTANVQGDIT